jgi:hypothetical protein
MYPIEIEPARAKKTLVFSLLGRLGEAGRQRITLSAPVAPLEAIVGNKEGGPSPKDESRLGADSRSPREVSTPIRIPCRTPSVDADFAMPIKVYRTPADGERRQREPGSLIGFAKFETCWPGDFESQY